MRKLAGNLKQSNTLLIFINQIRMKIGVMFGNPETTTGGNALKFYASVRLDIRRIGAVKEGDNVVGSETRVKVVKNKIAAPFKTGRIPDPLRRRHQLLRRAGRPRREREAD
ncbi:recombinase A [Klebsiella pneumoniae]|uniref:Protein RecA n=1 Tax=Klebsiella pneumoniae TaxID=573 RepID=A0A378BVD2_KLEPN|nr:recombinase A [Klebsiella pneumoniae]